MTKGKLMSVNELVDKLLEKIDHYLSYEHSRIGDAYLRGEKGAYLLIKEFLETGEIPDMLKE